METEIASFCRPELIREILSMYLAGMPVIYIADYFGISCNDINKIIDQYSPYME